MAQLFVLAAVLMVDRQIRLTHERLSGPTQAIENIQIAATGQRRARVQRFIEAAEILERRAAENHVGARAEDARAAGIRRRTGKRGAETNALEVLPEAAHLLKHD